MVRWAAVRGLTQKNCRIQKTPLPLVWLTAMETVGSIRRIEAAKETKKYILSREKSIILAYHYAY